MSERVIERDGLMVTYRASAMIEQLMALDALSLPVCFIWESDDSPNWYATTESMIDYAYNCGGRVIRLDTYGVEQITDKGKVSSGKFMYIEY